MALLVERVDAFRGPVQVLHGVSVEVPQGAIVAVLGRNGMGKTTLAETIMGMLTPRSGRILLDGAAIHGLVPEKVNRKGVTLMPQRHRIFPSLSVRENLNIAYRRVGGSKGWTVEEILQYLPLLEQRSKQRAGTLSGGEQQMLAMGRTLVGNGAYVLLDEPAEGLAPAAVERFGEIIGELRRRGAGVLLVEQRFEFATRLADVVYVMSRGVDVFKGGPLELRADQVVKEKYLGL